MRRLTTAPIAAAVRLGSGHPWLTLLVCLLLSAAALVFAAGHFSMTSDTAKLISDKVPWRQHEIAMDAAFPQNGDTTVVVVDGATPELAEQAAASLAAKLEPQDKVFLSARRPDGGAFFAREGLLFLPTDQVRATADQLVSAQPFLGPLAADPSLRGVAGAIGTMADGVTQGQTTFAAVDKPLAALADVLQKAAAGKPAFFSWQALVAGDGKGLQAPTRRFIVVRPKLDYGGLMPGEDASDAIRATAKALSLDAAHGVTVRLTGSVPLSDEEFASLTDRVWLVTGSMGLAVLVMLWLAVKSARLVAAILTTTLIGLLLTAAMGLVTVGRFNLISVAFIPLFVGLGVDFGIQFSVRFRAERLIHDDRKAALEAAATGIGGSLALAAAAITLGFLAFLPTPYIGVSELGIIAGVGMVIGLVLNITLLPALILIFRTPRQTEEVGSRRMAPLDRFLVERRKTVLWAFAASTLVSVALLPFVRFDFNPMHLRNAHGEAMSTLNDIIKDPTETPNTIDVLAPSLDAANKLADRLGQLPQVAQAITLASFIPDDQPAKLAAISDAQLLLDPTLNPFETQPTPTDAETVAALKATAAKLRAAAGTGAAQAGAADALRLAGALETLASGPPDGRARATAALIPPLNTLLDQLRALLTAEPVTLQSLPPDMVRDWVTPDGRARAQVSPKGDSNDNKVLAAFSKAVRTIAPDASGAPISIQEAGKTISRSFIEAGLLSLVAITALLLLVLRSLREVAFTLAPIVLAGFLTLGTCVLIGQPINFANIIAFPLLFGVGVAFHIYFVMAWRAGTTNLLQSSLARGVFFSAMTTGTAFGSLMFSSHPGTASMGKILMISLIWTLVAALIFEPALLGPTPTEPKGEPAA
ncbi:MMPL family transporter [Phenylobacterium sp.]|uniref:hopanoid transporter HpnN n=1 Tax=Phenylobacterium sp. TaxID=1871053 RepID=UPI0012248B78|nr:MMPL family transporter [Phenylobacterium sp.]THD61326.1 MAG: hopanoid biosynthesis-associated RND transporter HpnN [Phenylobacterium sp.]